MFSLSLTFHLKISWIHDDPILFGDNILQHAALLEKEPYRETASPLPVGPNKRTLATSSPARISAQTTPQYSDAYTPLSGQHRESTNRSNSLLALPRRLPLRRHAARRQSKVIRCTPYPPPPLHLLIKELLFFWPRIHRNHVPGFPDPSKIRLFSWIDQTVWQHPVLSWCADGLAGAEERGDADAGAAGGVCRGGVPGRVRDGGLPAHAARLRRWGCAHGARHRPQLALLQPAPAQVARHRRGWSPPPPSGQQHNGSNRG